MNTIFFKDCLKQISESIAKQHLEHIELNNITRMYYSSFFSKEKIVKVTSSNVIGKASLVVFVFEEIEGCGFKKENDYHIDIDILSPYSGYAILNNYYQLEATSFEELFEVELGKVFSDINGFLSYLLPSAEIVCDPFTKNKNLIWANNFSYQIRFYPSIGVTLEYKDNNSFICYTTSEKYRLHQGDIISLLFENGNIIDFPIQKTVVLDGACSAYCSLFREDVELFINERCCQYRITYCKSDKAPLVENFTDKDYSPYEFEMFVAYAKHYLNELNRLIPDYHLPRRTIIKTPVDYKFPGCYVYLMLDNSNGYNKIGISNTPEYREKTLQSEKPSIEMLACKKFPTRKIAEAIESALHTAYSQQRVRGEWFNLDDVDVAAIIETLK